MGIDRRVADIQAHLPRLTAAQAYAAVQETGAFLVDTRPEYQRGKAGEIPGAIVIERNHLEWRLDPASPARIPEASHYQIRWIVICEGGFSSSLAAQSLRDIGLSSATDVIDGFLAWEKAGLPIVHPAVTSRGRAPRQGPPG